MNLAASTLHLLDRPLEQVFPDLLSLGTRNIELADSGHHALNPKLVERLQEHYPQGTCAVSKFG